MVRHGGCLGLGLAAMGTARQGKNICRSYIKSHYSYVTLSLIDITHTYIYSQ